jgi:hypothetical protein
MQGKGLGGNGSYFRITLAASALLAVLVVGACSTKDRAAGASDSAVPASAEEGAAVVGATNRKGSFLAYEHDVSIRLPSANIPANMAAVRDACMSERLGTCSVLAEDMTAGEAPFGNLKMRAEPKAVQGLVQLAAKGGEVGQRSTHAEDLADAVKSNELEHQRMLLNHEKLSELLARKDLKLADVIELNERMAQLEAGLQAAEQEAAQQQRRIQTNLLTLHFSAEGVSVDSSRIPQAVRGLGTIWDNTIAGLITVIGTLLPFALIGLLIWWVVRFFRRRRRLLSTATNSKQSPEDS